jgi:N-acetylneuraminic acid mutarotase
MACAVANGKIYILGGYTSSPFQPVNNTYEYSSITNTWTAKSPVPTIRGASAAGEIGGKIYVIGGAGFNLLQSNDINEMYDPLADAWETKAPMPTARDHHAVIVLDTLLYSIGGRNFSFNIGSNSIVEAYSPLTNKWYPMDSLIWARSGFSLASANNKIYAIGGEWFTPGQSGLRAQIEVYDPKLNNWEFLTTMQTTRHGLGAGVVSDTIYTISGGIQAGFSYSDVNEAFAPGKSIGIQQISEVAVQFVLYQNYPNPFNPATMIRFDILENENAGIVNLAVYDVLGREIDMLVNQELQGSFEVIWNATKHPSGMYFYRLSYNDYSITRKMILIK